jgi:hypothetical protein
VLETQSCVRKQLSISMQFSFSGKLEAGEVVLLTSVITLLG